MPQRGNPFSIEPFRSTFPPDLEFLAPLRRSLRDWLEEAGIEDPTRAEVVLAIHEATANAIEHSDSNAPIDVRARVSVASVAIEVRDHGRWRESDDDDEGRGRGLKLIENLVSALKIETSESGTTLRLLQQI
jgi:anti-sigma regulatory factor (Ser/Thr protein kinase)